MDNSLVYVLRKNVRQYAMLIALIVITIFFQIVTNGILLVPMNVTNLILQNAYVFILAIGMTITILTGGNIDLSVGSIVAFIGAICGSLIITMNFSVGVALVCALVLGILIGAWQGFWIAYVRIPAFIVTLAGMLVFRGLTVFMLKGLTINPFPESFQFISSGFLPDIPIGWLGNLHSSAIILGAVCVIFYVISQLKHHASQKRDGFNTISGTVLIVQIVLVSAFIMLFSVWLARYKGIPFIFLIIGVLVLLYAFFTTRTVPGRFIYAMGGNEKAAKLSGINTNQMLFLAYVNMGFLAAVAGIAYTARLNAASPQSGLNFELDAIAACFIGGASAYGGIGTVVGSIIGALVMGVLNNGMSILGIGSDVQQIVKGLVLLFAVAFDVLSKKKSG